MGVKIVDWFPVLRIWSRGQHLDTQFFPNDIVGSVLHSQTSDAKACTTPDNERAHTSEKEKVMNEFTNEPP